MSKRDRPVTVIGAVFGLLFTGCFILIVYTFFTGSMNKAEAAGLAMCGAAMAYIAFMFFTLFFNGIK